MHPSTVSHLGSHGYRLPHTHVTHLWSGKVAIDGKPSA